MRPFTNTACNTIKKKNPAKYNTQTTTVLLFYGDLCPAQMISEI